MKKQLLRYAIPLMAAGLCILWADTKVDYDHNADFSRYHTYSWIKAEAGDSLTREIALASGYAGPHGLNMTHGGRR
jgi:hypothetical protein